MSDLSCADEMWPSAEIDEVALSIKAQGGISRQGHDDLGLVGLSILPAPGQRSLAIPFFPDDCFITINDLVHAGFDPDEVVISKSVLSREIVEKSLLRGGSCRERGIGKQFTDGLRKDMCCVVADQGKRLGV
ncbi:hypothetical protein GOX01_23250 [Gluconobacter oxydans]|nr:hypothetical protein GOX01_23250 [Gluconobacter oxydans]